MFACQRPLGEPVPGMPPKMSAALLNRLGTSLPPADAGSAIELKISPRPMLADGSGIAVMKLAELLPALRNELFNSLARLDARKKRNDGNQNLNPLKYHLAFLHPVYPEKIQSRLLDR
jgi:hypothetical protein